MAEKQPGRLLVYTEDEPFLASFARSLRFWMETVCITAELVRLPGWEAIASLTPRDILFLDIDGLGCRLPTPPVGALVLCSKDPGRSIACYALHPADFLSKPVSPAALERAMGRCIPLWQDRLKWLDTSAGRVQVPLCELMWAEASGHSTLLHCVHGAVRDSESLSGLEAKLPPGIFLRCQRSFLVNLRYVRTLENGFFTMACGEQVPIGRGNQNQAAQACAAFRRLFNGFFEESEERKGL